MRPRPHPTFARYFLKTFLRIWLTGAVAFVLIFALPAIGLPLLGRCAIAVFVIDLAGGMAYLSYRLFHQRCPECGGLCKTRQAATREVWVAQCSACDIEWDLGVGTNSSDP